MSAMKIAHTHPGKLELQPNEDLYYGMHTIVKFYTYKWLNIETIIICEKIRS